MLKSLRCSFVFWAALLCAPAILPAQQKPLHLNPVIAKLAEGKTVYGLNTGDLSLVYAREVARAPVDFIYADMEHNPLDFPALHLFLKNDRQGHYSQEGQSPAERRVVRAVSSRGRPVPMGRQTGAGHRA